MSVLADSVTGNVEVKQANLTVSLGDVFRVYGDLNADYNIADVTGLVNEDEDGTVTFNKDMITDGGLVDNKTKTNNANRENEHYTWSFDKEALGGVANLLNNYSVTINDGKSTVTKANLKVDLDAVTRVYGDLDADYNNRRCNRPRQWRRRLLSDVQQRYGRRRRTHRRQDKD